MIAGLLILAPIPIGIIWFFVLINKLKYSESNNLIAHLFLVFMCYGALLEFILVCLFGAYSPAIVLGILFIFIVCPIIMWYNKKEIAPYKDYSDIHQIVWKLSGNYSKWMLLGLIIMFLFYW